MYEKDFSDAAIDFDESTIMQLMENTSFMFPAGDWFDSRPHLPVLYAIARHITCPKLGVPIPTRPPLCLEIGVRQGPSTLVLLQAMKRTNGHLISLDTDPIETAVATNLVNRCKLDKWWEFHLVHSDEFHKGFSGELDLLWIDGDHRPPQPSIDLANYKDFVRVGGMILLHDYWLDGVDNGVQPAIDSILRSDKQWELMTLPYTFGLTLVRKVY